MLKSVFVGKYTKPQFCLCLIAEGSGIGLFKAIWRGPYGRWTVVHRPWSVDHGPRTMVHGPWSMVHGPWTRDNYWNMALKAAHTRTQNKKDTPSFQCVNFRPEEL